MRWKTGSADTDPDIREDIIRNLNKWKYPNVDEPYMSEWSELVEKQDAIGWRIFSGK